MTGVFLSYATKSAGFASSLAWILERHYGAIVYYMDDPVKKYQQLSVPSIVEWAQQKIEASDVFIQVLEDSLGTPPPGHTRGILEIETELLKEQHPDWQNRFIGISLGSQTDEAVQKYLSAFGVFGVPFASCPYVGDAISLVSKRYPEVLGAEQGLDLYPGVLEIKSDSGAIVEMVKETAKKPGGLLPQKYLYASPHGAELWCRLCEPHGSYIGSVYSEFPVTRGATNPVASSLRSAATESMRSMYKDTNGICGVMVLGCGDGRREAQTCEWLLKDGMASALRVVFVDVSTELIQRGIREVAARLRSRSVDTRFAVVDFEKQPEELRSIRRRMLGEIPVVFLFLGNTLNNIDAEYFAAQVANAAEPRDVLFAESLLHAEGAAQEEDDAPRRHGLYFQFVTHPLVVAGLAPNPSHLSIRRREEEGREAGTVNRRFVYSLDRAECNQLLGEGSPGSAEIELLQIKSMTLGYCKQLFRKVGFDNARVEVERYTKGTPFPVTLGYVVGAKS